MGSAVLKRMKEQKVNNSPENKARQYHTTNKLVLIPLLLLLVLLSLVVAVLQQ